MANSRRCFLGENGRPLRLFCRRIDAGQYCSNKCFDYNSSDIKFCKLSVSSTSVVGIIMDIQSEGSWLESARTIDIFTVSYTFKLKAHGSNPLNNSRGVPVYHSTTVCLGFCIYHYYMLRGYKPGAFKIVK